MNQTNKKTHRKLLWFFDAFLLSLMLQLAEDAVYYLRYGDIHWEAWYERAINPVFHLVIFPPTLFCLAVTRRLGLPGVVQIGAGLIGGFCGSLLIPDIAN